VNVDWPVVRHYAAWAFFAAVVFAFVWELLAELRRKK
jgi:hypothetical protein